MTWSGGRRAAARIALTAASLLAAWGAGPVFAEPTFLAKQYPRCTACHYSESGGGLLTPYGRSLSREEISTFGRQGASVDPAQPAAGEEGFLFGALGNESPLQLGLDIRPSHLGVNVPGRTLADRNFLMTLDLQAAWRRDRWTAYGTVGRQPRSGGGRVVSYEHWVSYQVADGVSVRGGRFLPAYGVRFADHTSFTRERLDLAQDDQIYGVEVGVSTDRTLLQSIRRPGTRRITDRRGRTRRLHRKRPVPDRRRSAHRPRGIRPPPRRIGRRPLTHRRRTLLRLRPDRLAHHLDACGRSASGVADEQPLLHRCQPDIGRGGARPLAPRVPAGALDG